MKHKLWLSLLLMSSFILGCILSDKCSSTVEERISAPGSKYDLVKFTRRCGATVGNTTEISLVNPGAEPGKEPANIFRIYQDSVQLQWASNTEVIIRFPEDATIFLQENKFKDVTIKYEKLITKRTFDSTKRITINAADLDSFSVTHAEWRWGDKVYNIQERNQLNITDLGTVKQIADIISEASPIDTNYLIHTDWMFIRINGDNNGRDFVLIRDRYGDFYINYKNDYYEGVALAKFISLVVESYR